MGSGKTWWILVGLGLTLALLAGCSENKGTNPYGKGSIVGTVEPKDCGAKVVALQGKPVDSTWVDDEGYYRIDNLTVGTYAVKATAPGYSIYTSKEVTVYSGGVTTVPLMKLSPVPEQISSTSPQDGEKDVELANQIYISFRNPMERKSVESSLSIKPSLEGEFVWHNKNRSLYYRPFFPLIPETTYTVTLTRGAQTQEEDSLSFDYSFSFTTDRIRIESTYPPDKRKDVELSDYIFIRFNTEMDHNSTKNALSIDPPLSCTYNWSSNFPYSGTSLHIGSNLPLRADTKYTIVIGKGAKDVNGFSLPESDSIHFSTESIYLRRSFPPNWALDVSTRAYIRFSFNAWMDEKSLDGAITFSPPIEGYFSSGYQSSWGSDIYFNPGSPLATSTKYMVKISQAATDIYGTRLAEPDSLFFTTEPLRVTYTSPINGATWVDTTTSIRIHFNTYMDQERTEEAFSISPLTNGHFEWSSLDRFYFYPDANLKPNTTYTVQIDTTAQEISGGKLPYPYQFSFSTRK